MSGWVKAVAFSACFHFSGCNGDVVTKEILEKLISKNLSSSSTNREIMGFFENQNWVYSFDRHVGRYQARNPDEDQLPESQGRHQIYIYVDEEKNFVKAEVERVFNAL